MEGVKKLDGHVRYQGGVYIIFEYKLSFALGSRGLPLPIFLSKLSILEQIQVRLVCIKKSEIKSTFDFSCPLKGLRGCLELSGHVC